jgi:hypothetical protein
MATGNLIQPKSPNGPETKKGNFIIALRAGNTEQEFYIQIDCLKDVYQENNVPLYLLPILSGRTGSAKFEEGEGYVFELMIAGIVLRTTGGTRGEFSRIGCFNFYKDRVNRSGNKDDEKEEEETYERFLKVLEECGTVIARAACAETTSNSPHPNQRYVIKIV